MWQAYKAFVLWAMTQYSLAHNFSHLINLFISRSYLLVLVVGHKLAVRGCQSDVWADHSLHNIVVFILNFKTPNIFGFFVKLLAVQIQLLCNRVLSQKLDVAASQL